MTGEHEKCTIGDGSNIPPCLTKHIQLANSQLAEPFSDDKIRRMEQSIATFLYDMSKGRVGNQYCQELVEHMEYIPEPEILLEYVD